jgi:archaemetzincin
VERILIVPIEAERRVPLQTLASDIATLLRAETEVTPALLSPASAFDGSRRQYHSGTMLLKLLEFYADTPGRILGITAHDLFLPVLTFVFGQAQLGNRGALFSTHRLRNEFYGLPPSEDALYLRALKEAMHELGHTYGLRHCLEAPCAMNASTYVEDIDLKPASFCDSCEALRKVL